MKMGAEFGSLTGRWLGKYEYGRAVRPVGFEADLIQEGGVLSGDCREPNSFRKDQGAELFAVFSGYVHGSEVWFEKHYLGFVQGDHPSYLGQVNAALTRIEGTWHFPKHSGWTGRFVMMRKPLAAASAELSAATELEFTR